MRSLYDTQARFREATNRMTTGTNTYVCGCCGGYQSIAGRKPMESPGRRKLFKCARCIKEGK